MFKLININYPETAKNSKYINNDTLTVLDDKSCLKFATGINHDDIKASYGRSHYVFVGDLLPSSRPKYRKFDLYARMYVVCNEKQDRIFITDKVPGYPGYGLMLFYHNTEDDFETDCEFDMTINPENIVGGILSADGFASYCNDVTKQKNIIFRSKTRRMFKMDSCTFCSFFADNAHEVEYITEDEVDKVVNLIKPLD